MASNRITGDTRLRKSNDAAERGQHPAALQDRERANDDGTELTNEERLALLRNEYTQEALPRAPEIPGYHTCWLSTTHPYDPIHKRQRLGYTLVRQDDVVGFNHMKTSSGEYADYVMCNEMVLAKIPEALYQMIMKELHHDQPLREEEAINQRIQEFTERDGSGKELTVRDEGFEERELVKRRPAPVFY